MIEVVLPLRQYDIETSLDVVRWIQAEKSSGLPFTSEKEAGVSNLIIVVGLSKKDAAHFKYPYLLRNVRIIRPDQVWSTDITYIRMQQGFLYLVAILDWFSRYVLSWRLSNSLDTSFCIEALEEALEKGCPDIFNSDFRIAKSDQSCGHSFC